MVGLVERYKLKSVAADMAQQDGRDWGGLTDMEKEKYYSKAYQSTTDKKLTRPVKQKKPSRY